MEREQNKILTRMNTFGFAVRADRYIAFESVAELREIFSGGLFRNAWYLLGGGSNILFTGDYHGTILHPVNKRIEKVRESAENVVLKAEAGVVWDDFVAYCVGLGLYGVENLSWIPGLVGASPVQNIGAYGKEVKDAIITVEVYLPDEDRIVRLSDDECRFGYRDSVFKHELKGKAIVTAVEFLLQKKGTLCLGYGDLGKELEKSGGVSLQQVRDAVIRIRSQKLPDPAEIGNAGSFFKNPVVPASVYEGLRALYPDMPCYPAEAGVKIPAGWMIEKTGWKGYRRGDAGVHEKQALVLVNYGSATGQDIRQLSQAIRDDIRSKFGITIEEEVNIV